ncbi:hypothetical protein [Lacinutrix sp. Hel_I_90]|uniref:hypothetical protein n=1 Tax=Lacinutrix sp. Hel_I_90 TaxID=1249999 RepID=UPI0005C821B7|nr:hypothetical protein [Lacinutrix sp. Hel_I_90]
MRHFSLLRTNKLPLLLTVISVLLYVTFAYDLMRTDYIKLMSLYVALFFIFYKLIQLEKYNTRFLTAIAFIFRAVFIFSIPNLSQDFYRFIWDGRMLLEGFNPYLYTPESFILKGAFPVAQTQELYLGMGELNASHFTNYPPVNQLCFVIAGFFAGKSILGSVFVLRLLIIAADFGTLYFGKKLLKKLKLPVHNLFFYILNPFIIIELTGNLHFEGVMVFFLVWSLYLLHAGQWKFAAVIFALSIATKLIPLLFLPLFFGWFLKRTVFARTAQQSVKQAEIARSHKGTHIAFWKRIRTLLVFYVIVGLTTLLLFAPFLSIQFIELYFKTVGLWFSDFEFNASMYYIFREIGYLFRGWNEIGVIGSLLPVLVLLFVLYLSFFKKNRTTKQLLVAMLFAFTFYLFASTTVHPWYLATLLFLSVFTNYKFPLVWSFIIIISYLAYANTDNTENLWIIALEYVVVYGFLIWELFIKQKRLESSDL